MKGLAEALEAKGIPHALPVSELADLRPAWLIGGRVGVGKTTLINGIAATPVGAVGLGGTTRDTIPYSIGPADWIDTPGCDAADAALEVLVPASESTDGLIWVTDGLQPMTATERQILAHFPPAGLVISRWDCIPEPERAAVLARVRTLQPESPWIQGLDLRTERLDTDCLSLAGSLRRKRIMSEAIATERRRWMLTLRELQTEWRLKIRNLASGPPWPSPETVQLRVEAARTDLLSLALGIELPHWSFDNGRPPYKDDLGRIAAEGAAALTDWFEQTLEIREAALGILSSESTSD